MPILWGRIFLLLGQQNKPYNQHNFAFYFNLTDNFSLPESSNGTNTNITDTYRSKSKVLRGLSKPLYCKMLRPDLYGLQYLIKWGQSFWKDELVWCWFGRRRWRSLRRPRPRRRASTCRREEARSPRRTGNLAEWISWIPNLCPDKNNGTIKVQGEIISFEQFVRPPLLPSLSKVSREVNRRPRAHRF